jgi:hypothetical protein
MDNYHITKKGNKWNLSEKYKMKKMLTPLLTMLMVTGCDTQTVSSLDIDALISRTEAKAQLNKKLAIHRLHSTLKDNINRLEQVCSEGDLGSNEHDNCESTIASLKSSFDDFRSGDWEALHKVSYNDFVDTYFEAVRLQKTRTK